MKISRILSLFIFAQIILAPYVHAEIKKPAAKTINLRDLGAVGDGFTDDTEAIQAWLACARPGYNLVAPPGIYNFSSPLSIAVPDIAINGAGPYQTVFRYTGASTIVDLFTIGTLARETGNLYLHNFRIASSTNMTAGTGLHSINVVRSFLDGVVADGQDGNGNLFNGFWFDRVDSVYLDQYEARAKNDAIRVNGTVGPGPKAGLTISNGRILFSHVGLHIAGGFGGISIDTSDVISNDHNVLIDAALVAEGNREIFLLDGATFDTSSSDSILVNDTLANSGTLLIASWVATGQANGINIQNWLNGRVSIQSPVIWNFLGDGIRVQDATTRVAIDTATLIHDNQGFGVNATVPTINISPGAEPFANFLGAYSANATVENLTSASGFIKYPNGKILQWITVSFTGAANTILNPTIGNPVLLPIPFPTAALAGSIVTSPQGFANGAANMTASATPSGANAVIVNLVSSVTVTNPQDIKVVVWGY